MQIVLDLDSRERSLELESPGFESCIVKPPTSLVERRALGHFYRRRSGVNAREFVDALLAFYLAPRRRPRELRTLSAADRSRLRLSVVAASGSLRDWRKLYGSHLSADQRLFAVMYWRWRSNADQLVVPHGQLEELVAEAQKNGAGVASCLGVDPGGSALPESLAAQAVAGVRTIDAREWLSPGLANHVKQLTQLTQGPNLSPLYDARSSSVGMGALAAATGKLGISASIESARRHMETVAPVAGALEAATGKFGISTSIEAVRAHLETVARFDGPAASSASLAGYRDPIGMKAAVESARSAAWRGIDPGGAVVSVARWMKAGTPYASVAGGLSGQGLVDLALGSTGIAKQLGQFRDKVEQYEQLFGLTTPGKWRSLGGGIQTPDLRKLGMLDPRDPQFEHWRRLTAAVRDIELFDKRWQRHSLYYLLGRLREMCDVMDLHPLALLENVEQVEEALLGALQAVALDGEFIPALRAEVARAPYLDDPQRTILDHGLEHAAEGDWVRACSSLYDGVEAAFFEVALAQAVIKVVNGKRIKFDSAVGRLAAAQELKTFMTRVVFGTVGNAYRHGSAHRGHRRQVLFLVAALTGWFEDFAGVNALDRLVERMVYALPSAAARARALELPAA